MTILETPANHKQDREIHSLTSLYHIHVTYTQKLTIIAQLKHTVQDFPTPFPDFQGCRLPIEEPKDKVKYNISITIVIDHIIITCRNMIPSSDSILTPRIAIL